MLLKNFAESDGFDKLLKILHNKPNNEVVHTIFGILNSSINYLHKDFIVLIGEEVYTSANVFLKDLSSNELRSMRKDTLEVINKVLKSYLCASKGKEEGSRIIEEFSISTAIKFLKTSSLDKRIHAVKTIIDIIKSARFDKDKTLAILQLIEDNQIFNEIYGANSHIQLINKSKELLEIMLNEDKLSDSEIELIWGATNKGDLEGKLTILKILKEISRSLNEKHINTLLGYIYASNSKALITDEIDVSFY